MPFDPARGQEDTGLPEYRLEGRARQRREALRVEQMPAALRVDSDQGDFVARPIERPENRGCGHDRDIVLDRSSPKEQSDAQLSHESPTDSPGH